MFNINLKQHGLNLRALYALTCITGLIGCTVPHAITHQYTITEYRTQHVSTHTAPLPSLFISAPEAITGFQTDQMLYRKFPFQTATYVHNGWSSAPAEMLYPLIIQSFQDSHAFRVVGSGTHAEISHYRLDTQLIELIQNYDKKPSQIELKVKAMISNTITAQIISSKVFRIYSVCPSDTPYGGVIAANRAAAQLTQQLTQYTITVVKRHKP